MVAVFEKRAGKLRRLAAKTADAVLVTSPENLRYLCGFTGTEGSLLVTADGTVFLTDGRYTAQAREQVNAESIITFKDKTREIARQIKKHRVKRLGYEARYMTVAQLRDLEGALAGPEPVPLADELDGLRMIKDAAEMRLLRRAAAVAARCFAETLPLIRPGMSEIDVAVELEYRMRKSGGSGPAFPTIVASGIRSAMPHGTASSRRLGRGELLTIDYGILWEGYCSDETCTLVLGEPTDRQRSVYTTVKRAHDLALAALRPGRPLQAVDAAARRHIEGRGLGRRFSHGTGHGLGLCVHEPPVVSPRSKAAAQKGMVLTIEPGVYIPGWGGVRIEDTAAVTPQGCEIITQTDKQLRVVGG